MFCINIFTSLYGILMYKRGDLMEKLSKILITISLIVLAINSFFLVGYLKTLTELIAALLNK